MKVVSVKFKENGRAYYFDPGEFKIKEGDFVVVTTARGTECGEVVRAAHDRAQQVFLEFGGTQIVPGVAHHTTHISYPSFFLGE